MSEPDGPPVGPPAAPPLPAGPTPPALRVVRGAPTDDELVALVVVIAALCARAAGDPGSPARPSRRAWNHPRRLVRSPVSPGPEGWRRSALPG